VTYYNDPGQWYKDVEKTVYATVLGAASFGPTAALQESLDKTIFSGKGKGR
jgi:hypothetical protein